jgi:hypothetical protein
VGQGGFFGSRTARFCFAALAIAVAACRDAAAPVFQPPYLAIVARIAAPDPATAGSSYRYHVRELSGTLGIDTVVVAAPTDTVVLSVPPATYAVDVEGIPPRCRVRDGTARAVLIAEGTNTTLIRYFVACQAQLTVTVLTDGAEVDSGFVYALTTSDGAQRVGLLHATDTLLLPNLPTGPAVFDLANVAGNCTVTNDGGGRRQVVIDSTGGAALDFRIVCSDPALRPAITALAASYHNGIGGLYLRAGDPDRDLERFSWDVTDCHRASVIGGARQRGHVTIGRTPNQDTITIVAAFDIGLPDSAMAGTCVAVWVADLAGNISVVWEVPLGTGGSPPEATTFNAHFYGTGLLRTEVSAGDADGDFAGVFVAFRLRDGVLGPTDGAPDVAYYNTSGFLGSAVPDLPLGTGVLTYDNFYAVIVYLIDARGNVTRLEDADLFQ